MTTTIALIIVSLLLSLGITPIVRGCALRLGFVDKPDNKRKIHSRPTARLGGVAIFSSLILTLAIVGSAGLLAGREHGDQFQLILSILPAATMVFLIGLADDLFSLKPKHKLLIQIAAAALVIGAGLRVGLTASSSAHGIFIIALTLLWIVGCSNAVNLIDGLDGLAGGIIVIACAVMMISASLYGDWPLLIAIAPLAGSVFGFLFYNWRPASIFMGDSGSLTSGFLLACYGVLWTRHLPPGLATLSPAMVLTIPILDTSLAMMRRFLGGRPMFSPDRSHIHHRLLSRGLTHLQSVLTLHVSAGLAAVLAFLTAGPNITLQWAAVGGFSLLVAVAIHRLGYPEFAAALRIVRRGDIRREVQVELMLEHLEAGLELAQTVEDCWQVLAKALKDTGYHLAVMRLRGQWIEDTNLSAARRASVIGIAISGEEWIEVVVEPHKHMQQSALVPFISTMRRYLASKSLTVDQPAFLPDPILQTTYETAIAVSSR